MKGLVSAIAYLLLVFANLAPARAAFTFDDIQYWIGSGTNRAAIVIDWSDGSTNPPALVWGFRWNGAANGLDMRTAVVRTDDRLFAKFDGSVGNEDPAYGLGYDANNNGQFSIDDNTAFDSQGVAFTGPADGAHSVSSVDYYAEGWFTGFWHYGVASSDPYAGGQWTDSQVGAASHMLVDGAWDSWTFTPTFNFAAFAQNPQAATSPAGDFNGDHRVDSADYTLWKSTFGSITLLGADGNHNGIVDAADYTVWRDHLVLSSGMSSSAAVEVAEPSSLVLALCLLSALQLSHLLQRKVCVS
jgi:hypothetical protein